jgi:phospholipid/cholesterol/gamma-HCH transport system substrate-binding protein
MTAQQRVRAVGLVLFMGVCFLIAADYFRLAGTNLVPGSSPYMAQAIVPTGVSLAPSADIREYGVTIGKIDKIASAGPDGRYTLIEFQLDSHAPLYQNAQVYIRAKSVAGENYVELDPGTPAAGAMRSGGVLGIQHSQDATQIDQIFSIFDHTRQHDLRRALGGLNQALSGGGQNLNGTLEAAAALPSQGANAAAILAGDRTQLADLIDTFGTVSRALGERGAAIQDFTRQVKVTAQAVAVRDAQLKATLGQLPPFLAQATTTADRLRSFAEVATPVLGNLRAAATDLVPAVATLLPAARQGRTAMRALDAFATAVTPTVHQLQPFAAAAGGFVPALEAFLRQAKPMVTYLAPYFREMGSFFAQDAASFQPTDSRGHVARIELPISQSDLAGIVTPQQQQALQQLLRQFDARGFNAYPVPGQAGSGVPLTGNYSQIQADPPYMRTRTRKR